MSALGSHTDNFPLTPEQILAHPAIQALLADPSLTLRAAADRFNLGATTLSRWLRTLRRDAPEVLPPSRARNHPPRARRSNTSAGDVTAFNKGDYKYPIYARAKAGPADSHPQFDADPLGHFHSGIRIPARGGVAPFALRIRGDSMTNPSLPYHFPDGTDVLIDPHIEPQPADFVAVACVEDGGGVVVKRLVRESQAGGPEGTPTYSLMSLNPVYAPTRLDEEQHRVIGVVVDSRLPSYTRSRARAM